MGGDFTEVGGVLIDVGVVEAEVGGVGAEVGGVLIDGAIVEAEMGGVGAEIGGAAGILGVDDELSSSMADAVADVVAESGGKAVEPVAEVSSRSAESSTCGAVTRRRTRDGNTIDLECVVSLTPDDTTSDCNCT